MSRAKLGQAGACLGAFLGLLLWVDGASAYGGGHWLSKVKVCKVPRGDLSKAHEIKVPKKVAKWILKKHPGSSLGPCPDACSTSHECDDGDVCTRDICNPDGSCDNSEPVSCDDGNECTVGLCISEGGLGCTYPAVDDGANCDDGSLCTENDQCVNGMCTGDKLDENCCDKDADCGGDACEPQVCSVANQCVTTVKPECGADACFVPVCDPTDADGDGELCEQIAVDCDDGDICTDDSCIPNACMTPSGSFDTCSNVLNPNNGADNEIFRDTCNDTLDNDCDGLTDEEDDDCTPRQRVFITVEDFNGDLGGLSGADAICQGEADRAGLGGSFVAWLSTSDTDARDRVDDVLYRRLDGQLVAVDLNDLTDGSIANPINLDVDGGFGGGRGSVFTGTLADGTAAVANCQNWTSSDFGGGGGGVGRRNLTNSGWTIGASNAACGTQPLPIYCFEVVKPELRVFITVQAFNGDLGGLSGADAICQGEADRAGLGGTFVAWLSTSDTDARDRVDDVLYRRLDGQLVAVDLNDLTDGSIANPINLDVDGGLGDGPGFVFTGTLADGTAAAGNCQNWTSDFDVAGGGAGQSNLTNSGWTIGALNFACDKQQLPIYCFEVP